MEENQLAIPFDIKRLEESFLKKALRKLTLYIKAIIRRAIDIVGATVGIIFVIPLTIVVWLQNLKEKDYGPIFYAQERIGKDGKIFKMYKFRTMVVGAEQKLDELLQNDEQARKEYDKYKKIKNDPRITKTGEFLRRTSLDEFPQFINVLKGEMSLVGPRPYVPREVEDMGTYYKYIIQHKPGITGLWQISGRNELEFLDRLDLDMKYHYKKNLKNDLKILIITVLVTLKKKGAM